MSPYILEIERGYEGPIEFDFGEDVLTASGTFVVYERGGEPNSTTNQSGTPRFTKNLTSTSRTRLGCQVTATETNVAGDYYMRGVRIVENVKEPWHGIFRVLGK